MNQRFGVCLTLPSILIAGFAKSAQSVAAKSLETDLKITIHVYNYTDVHRKTLMEAEKIASGVFHKTGVESRWLDWHEKNKSSDEPEQFDRNDFALHILPRSM